MIIYIEDAKKSEKVLRMEKQEPLEKKPAVNFMKMKHLFFKETHKKMKRQVTEWEKCLQYTYPAKDM